MSNTRAQFENASRVLEECFADRAAPLVVRQVYGQGAGPDEDDDGEFLSPLEALELDREEGVTRSIMIPYEFWGDAMDALVVLRESLGFEPEEAPYYDEDYETRFTYRGQPVEVWSADYGHDGKGTAHLARVSEAILVALEA